MDGLSDEGDGKSDDMDKEEGSFESDGEDPTDEEDPMLGDEEDDDFT
jgi:hypothetical protein